MPVYRINGSSLTYMCHILSPGLRGQRRSNSGATVASLGRVTNDARPPDRYKRREKRVPKPLDRRKLDDLALFYVGRFATTRARLAAYLQRKLRERGWADDTPPDIEGLVERLAEHRYIDDAAWAEAKARSMGRRGLGGRRVRMAMQLAGVTEPDREGGEAVIADERTAAAWRFAQRKRLGPFAATPLTDRTQRQKAFASFARAGHDGDLTRRILDLPPGADMTLLDEPS
jgi:regulatory protein